MRSLCHNFSGGLDRIFISVSQHLRYCQAQTSYMSLKTCEWCGKKFEAKHTPSCRFVKPRFKKKSDDFTPEDEECSESKRLEFNGLIFVGVEKSRLAHFCCKEHQRLWQERKEAELAEAIMKLSSKPVDALQMQVAVLEFSQCYIS